MRPAALLVALLLTVASSARADGVPCATASSPLPVPIPVSADTLRAARRTGAAAERLGSFHIVLVMGPTLQANPDAATAFRRAADRWEAFIGDPITVTIDADLADLGDPITIGQTNSVILSTDYDVVRDALVADASSDVDDVVSLFLPTAAQLTTLLPPGFTLDGQLAHTKAALKAIGFPGLDDPPPAGFGPVDADIVFNTRFSFDFDNSDGVGPGLVDFETTAAHEIGHALGFVSTADVTDAGVAVPVAPTVLDLYRFSIPRPTTLAEFTTASRDLRPGIASHLDDLMSIFPMSTGVLQGDGRQCSHWKDNDLSGLLIGIMDPTLASGQVVTITEADRRAMDLIGYDVSPVAVSTTTIVTTTTTTSSTSTTTTLPIPITGKKLLLRDDPASAAKRRMKLVARNPSIAGRGGAGTADDPVLHGGNLRIFSLGGAGFDATFDLPASAWRYLAPRNRDRGWVLRKQTPFKKILVKRGKRLKIVASGGSLPALADDPGDVAVLLRLGAREHCLVFGGTVSFEPGRRFLAKRAPAPDICPEAPAGGP